MSIREMLDAVIDMLNDEQMRNLLMLLSSFADTPTVETHVNQKSKTSDFILGGAGTGKKLIVHDLNGVLDEFQQFCQMYDYEYHILKGTVVTYEMKIWEKFISEQTEEQENSIINNKQD